MVRRLWLGVVLVAVVGAFGGWPGLVSAQSGLVAADESVLELEVVWQPQWADGQAAPGSYDLMLVVDFSAAMGRCAMSEAACAAPGRRIDALAPALTKLIALLGAEGDHRVGLIAYGPGLGARSGAQLILPLTPAAEAGAALSHVLGSVDAPREIPASELRGGGAAALGLLQARVALGERRLSDRWGAPVRPAVLLVASAVPEVIASGAGTGQINDASGPYGCGAAGTPGASLGAAELQMTCPNPVSHPGAGGVEAPIRATAIAADLVRAATGADIHALWLHPTLSAGVPRLDLVAPGRHETVNDVRQLEDWPELFISGLEAVCQRHIGAWAPASGARATLLDAGGAVRGQVDLDSAGRGMIKAPQGEYILAIEQHVLAPTAPREQRYSMITLAGRYQSLERQPLSLNQASVRHTAWLGLGQPDTARCPLR